MSIKHPLFQDKDQYDVQVVPLNKEGQLVKEGEEAENPRVVLNLPADGAFIEITQTNPPYAVMVVRADKEISALGLAEKFKFMVMAFQEKLQQALGRKRAILTAGVSTAAAALKLP